MHKRSNTKKVFRWKITFTCQLYVLIIHKGTIIVNQYLWLLKIHHFFETTPFDKYRNWIAYLKLYSYSYTISLFCLYMYIIDSCRRTKGKPIRSIMIKSGHGGSLNRYFIHTLRRQRDCIIDTTKLNVYNFFLLEIYFWKFF